LNDVHLSSLAAIAALIATYALVTLAQGALFNTRAAWLRERADQGDRRARRALRLVADSQQLAMTHMVIDTVLRFTIAGITIVEVSMPLTADPDLQVNDTLLHVLVLLAVGALTLILGEMVPEAIGSRYAKSIALSSAGPMRWLVALTRPLVVLVVIISKGISAFMGSSALVNMVTEEEIMTLIDAGHTDGSIEENQAEMIYSVLQLDQTRVSEVMVPRIDVVAVAIDKPLKEAGALFVQSGYSRIPVYENGIDNIRGLLYAKDLLTYWSNGDSALQETRIGSIRTLMRPAYFVPETKRADELLKELQTRKIHLAIVVDEYGGTAGLVTIENIIEEIIGDIQDEYDQNEPPEFIRHSDDEYTIDASMDLDDLNELLNVDLPTDDADTLGGYIYAILGRVPVIGETLEEPPLIMRVESVEGRRIRNVHVTRQRIEETTEDEDESTEEGLPISD
jgi:putative hemolysin